MRRMQDKLVVEDNIHFIVRLVEDKYKDKVNIVCFLKDKIGFTLNNNSRVEIGVPELARNVKAILDLTSSLYEQKITRLDVEDNRIILDRFTNLTADLNSFKKNLKTYSAIKMEQSLLRNGIPYMGIENVYNVPLYDAIEAFHSCERCVQEYLSAQREGIKLSIVFGVDKRNDTILPNIRRLDIKGKMPYSRL